MQAALGAIRVLTVESCLHSRHVLKSIRHAVTAVQPRPQYLVGMDAKVGRAHTGSLALSQGRPPACLPVWGVGRASWVTDEDPVCLPACLLVLQFNKNFLRILPPRLGDGLVSWVMGDSVVPAQLLKERQGAVRYSTQATDEDDEANGDNNNNGEEEGEAVRERTRGGETTRLPARP